MLRVNTVLKGFEYKGEFLDNNDLSDLLSGYNFKSFSDLIDFLEDNDGNYISDRINELADSKVDIYYYDLRKWSVDNYSYIEDAINEGLTDTKNFDFHKAIQAGQFFAYSNEFYSMINEFKDYLTEKYNF